MNNKNKLAAFIIGILFVVFTLVALNTSSSGSTNKQQEDTQKQPNVKVTELEGEAWKLVGKKKNELKIDDLLFQEDEILTGLNSRITLKFETGSVVKFGTNTNATLTSLKPENTLIDLWSGSMFTNVSYGETNKFYVNSGDYFFMTREGSIYIERLLETRLMVLNGKLEVHSMKDPEGLNAIVDKDRQWREKGEVLEMLDYKWVNDEIFLKWCLRSV